MITFPRVAGGSEGRPWQGAGERTPPAASPTPAHSLGVPAHFLASSASVSTPGTWILNPEPSLNCCTFAMKRWSQGSHAGFQARDSFTGTRWPSQALPAFCVQETTLYHF